MKRTSAIITSLLLASAMQMPAATDLAAYVAQQLGKSQTEAAKACATAVGSHGSHGPYHAFDGILFTGNANDRWVATINPEKTYLQFDVPETVAGATAAIMPTSYTVWGSSEPQNWNPTKRSPTSWILQGKKRGSENWEEIDRRKAVSWPDPLNADNAGKTFHIPSVKSQDFVSYRFIPLSSLLTEKWNVGISELSIDVEVLVDSPALLIQSDYPATTPAAGVYTDESLACASETVYEKDGFRYNLQGYRLETLVDGEWISDGSRRRACRHTMKRRR